MTSGVTCFPNIGRYRGYISLIQRYEATGQSHNPRWRFPKSRPRLLKDYFYLAGDTARRCDVELADCYDRLWGKGRTHKQAVCAVANKLASRAYAIMKRIAKVSFSPPQVVGEVRPAEARLRVQLLSVGGPLRPMPYGEVGVTRSRQKCR